MILLEMKIMEQYTMQHGMQQQDMMGLVHLTLMVPMIILTLEKIQA